MLYGIKNCFEESDEFKKQLLQRLNGIIQMNENFEYEKAILDKEWERISNQWGKEFPIVVTDPKYAFPWSSEYKYRIKPTVTGK